MNSLIKTEAPLSLKETFEKEAWKELLQLIEIVLLDKKAGFIEGAEKDALEERLASLLRP